MLLLFLACASAPRPDPWRAEVSARLADAALAFRADGDGFRASVSERRLSARFETGIVTLSSEEGDVRLRTLDVVPSLGACLDRFDPAGECIRRLEYTDDALTEWWAATPDGFEQGWELRAPARIEVEVEDAEVTPDHVWLGAGLEVDGLAAWDADGVPLRAWFEPSDLGFRVRVDDAEARYPVTIDPVYSTAAWSAVGLPTDPGYAQSAVGAGDVNNDGYDDVIVGAYGAHGYDGVAYVYLGGASGLSSVAAVTLEGEGQFGSDVAAAGDVNGDGYGDVIVGAATYASSTGRASVFLGNADGIATTAALVLDGVAASDRFGASVSGAGDVNGDGYDDVIVGAWCGSSGLGNAYVYLGSATLSSTTPVTTLTGEEVDSDFGISVSGAGDVDHDGYDDVIVGSDGYASDDGRAYVFHGGATGVATTATTLAGGTAESFGYAVSGAGDVNGDGYADVVVGEWGYDHDSGRAYVFQGSPTGVDVAAASILGSPSANTRFGWSVSGAGDVDADGYDDVIVGAYSGFSGWAYVYRGAASGLGTRPTSTLAEDDWYFGRSVASAGDVDGDGHADVIVGAMLDEVARVYTGDARGVDTTPATSLEGVSSESVLGIAVAGAGDVNADGYDDVIVGAWGYEDYVGRAYVYLGSADGLSDVAATTLEGAESYFGGAVDGAGDVNHDGYDDVIVGEEGYGGEAGRAYVFHGSAAGVSSTAATTITGAAPSTGLGVAVAGAGDVNGDGYADVVIGAYRYGGTVGSAYVHLGSVSGVSVSPFATVYGTASGEFFGDAVDGAGDVDGDGHDDVIVGAWGAGKAYVYLGSTTGLGAATTLNGSAADSFGAAVAGVGDVDGDGFADVAIGAWDYDSGAGALYVHHGSASGVATAATTMLTGDASSWFGRAVAGAGDVDGDGYDDIVVGGEAYAGMTGRAYLYVGSASGIVDPAVTVLSGEARNDDFGAAVAGAGDVDGDGYADVLVGAPGYDDDAGKAYLWLGYDPATDPDLDGVETGTDCDDADATVGEGSVRYPDADGDGYGGAGVVVCPGDVGYVDVSGDCDDGDAGVSPDAEERCNGVDDDCDGVVDPDTSSDVSAWYADGDADGYGAGVIHSSCISPAGYVASAEDCDDTSADVSPSGVERCNGTDDDCDGVIDPETSSDVSTWYADDDGDGYGGAVTHVSCVSPVGYVPSPGDCDDTSADVSPAGVETCDGTDEDCDGVVDPDSSIDARTWYADDDGDRFGSEVTHVSCDAPAGYVGLDGDCDDGLADVSPIGLERCNGLDDDCDGLVDPDYDTVDTLTWYRDADGDGFGTPDETTTACSLPAGWSADATDCDDTSATTYPGAPETWYDGVDQDCAADDDYDADADGYGTDDCDDTDAAVHPGASDEWYDGVDADCAGNDDFDADADGFGADDCGDTDAAVNPGAVEVDDNGKDDDCDGVVDVEAAEPPPGEPEEQGCACGTTEPRGWWPALFAGVVVARRGRRRIVR